MLCINHLNVFHLALLPCTLPEQPKKLCIECHKTFHQVLMPGTDTLITEFSSRVVSGVRHVMAVNPEV